MRSRAVLLWLLLFATCAARLPRVAFLAAVSGGDEPHYLLAAASLVQDGDLDVADDYRTREFADFYPYELDPHGLTTGGRLHEPHGAGFPMLIAPAFAVAGHRGVELFLAAVAALAGAFAYLLARRVTPDPWALGAALAVGLSPPLVSYGTAVYPELAAGAALAAAALLALRVAEEPRTAPALGCFALLATLPWLGTKFVPAGIVIGGAAAFWILRAQRRLLVFWGAEIVGFSGLMYVLVNARLYGGPTPYAAEAGGETATDAGSAADLLDRSYRLAALLVDREYGLLRWAPVFALALLGAFLLMRSRRERLAAAVPGHRSVEAAAAVCAGALGAQLLVASFLAPTMFGFWFPPRHLLAGLPMATPLVAWGMRRAPRAGLALAAVGVVTSAWLYLEVALGDAGLAAGRPDVPWGPLEVAFPLFDEGSPLPFALAGAAALALAALLALESRHWRQTAGATRHR